jgi:tetratricopeptide (TPR) repeat protein
MPVDSQVTWLANRNIHVWRDAMHRHLAIALLVLLGIPGRTAQGQSQGRFPPDSFTNLKVLPRNIPRDTLVNMMAGFTRALGVRCTYCHVGQPNQPLSTYDFASDEKQSKRNARVMIQMLHHINGEHLAQLETRVTPPVRVECATCHRGISPPRSLQDVLLASWESGGTDSAIATYRALRQRYYGSASYDFGEVPLADVAGTLVTRMGAPIEDGERLLALNVEMNPASNFAKRTHAQVVIRKALPGGADSVAAAYAALKARYGVMIGEQLLNGIGYDLLGSRQVDEAIVVFRLVVREFPSSANAYDSLGEAFMIKGDKAQAIANYERSLQLDGTNENARQKLVELRR